MLQELEAGNPKLSQSKLSEVQASLKDKLQECYEKAGDVNFGASKAGAVEAAARLEGAAQQVAKLGAGKSRQTTGFRGRCYVMLSSQCPEERVMKKRKANGLKQCFNGRSYVLLQKEKKFPPKLKEKASVQQKPPAAGTLIAEKVNATRMTREAEIQVDGAASPSESNKRREASSSMQGSAGKVDGAGQILRACVK